MCMGTSFVHRGYGVIEPVYEPLTERYRQAMCPCEKEIFETYKAKEEARERAKQEQAMKRSTFAWLGEDWSDLELVGKTFENFNSLRQPDAYEAARMFPDVMTGTFILHGSWGTGKTHLLAAMCNELRKQGVHSLFCTTPKLFSAIQDKIQRGESYTQVLKRAMSTPLLILDDIEKAKRTDFREEIYFAIVDDRVKKGLPIAISTNNMRDLESFVGAAVCSRFKVGQIAIEMVGDDYRSEL
jgi:DNA replication protein DnaC